MILSDVKRLAGQERIDRTAPTLPRAATFIRHVLPFLSYVFN